MTRPKDGEVANESLPPLSADRDRQDDGFGRRFTLQLRSPLPDGTLAVFGFRSDGPYVAGRQPFALQDGLAGAVVAVRDGHASACFPFAALRDFDPRVFVFLEIFARAHDGQGPVLGRAAFAIRWPHEPRLSVVQYDVDAHRNCAPVVPGPRTVGVPEPEVGGVGALRVVNPELYGESPALRVLLSRQAGPPAGGAVSRTLFRHRDSLFKLLQLVWKAARPNRVTSPAGLAFVLDLLEERGDCPEAVWLGLPGEPGIGAKVMEAFQRIGLSCPGEGDEVEDAVARLRQSSPTTPGRVLATGRVSGNGRGCLNLTAG